MKQTLIIFVKAPVSGKVKTRLAPSHSPEDAARLYQSWAREAFEKAGTLEGVQVKVAYDPHPKIPTPDWLTGGKAEYFLQEGSGLGEKMDRAFEISFQSGADRVVLIGSDSPGLPPAFIRKGFQALNENDLVLGPALDGGYYLIGLKAEANPDLFKGVSWSTAKVLEQTRANAERLGLKTHLLPEYFDVDRPEDWDRLRKKISVIIPVCNEEAIIAQSLERLKKSGGDSNLEIIVVDGGSADRTVELARSLADQVLISPRPGRGAQMHLGAQNSSGGILLFLHADTFLPEHWPALIQNVFSQNGRTPSAVAFELGFDSERWPYRLITAFARIRNRITGVPQGDQSLAVRRDAYFSSGGFSAAALMEEYFLLPKLRKQGRIQILKEAVRTSTRRYEESGPFRNALKNAGLTCLFFAGVSPQKLARIYRAGS